MGTFLFANPTSGRYAKKRIDSLLMQLKAAGISNTLFMVKTPAEVASCCKKIYLTDQLPFIIVAAGDGTINAVINCLIPGTATIAVLPLGTSNVLSAELGITSLDEGIKRILNGKHRPLAIGQLEMSGKKHRFALMAGIGLDGAVVRDLNVTEKRLFRQGGYFLSAIRNCLAWETENIEVLTDKETVNCHTAIVCNASRYGGNFILAPEGSIFSQGFVVACIKDKNRSAYLGAICDLISGKSASSPRIQTILCQEVEIKGNKPIQIDGDFVGYSPAKLVTVSDICNIIV
jgi:YegS/Rv2252/BmrU family lipid kinase